MQILQTILFAFVPVVLVLGVVITVHELGHFLAAKWLGTKIDQFSIGFGRAIASRKDRSGVEWRVGWLPIGGYVRFAGDDNAASIPDAEDLAGLRKQLIAEGRGPEINRYFHFKPLWQRAVITAAGPAANFILAIAIFAGLLLAFGEVVHPARVAQVMPGSAAEASGFRPGDLIIEANGGKIRSVQQVQELATIRADVPTEFVVRRDGRDLTILATPRWTMVDDAVAGRQRVGRLGLDMRSSGESFVVRYNPIEAIVAGAEKSWRVLTTSVYYLGRMISGQVGADQLRGPIGIASVAKNVAELGAQGAPDIWTMAAGISLNLIQLAALISISIGFMNLLPVPVLDGGHLLFYAYEAVFRRPLAAKVQAAGYRVGLALVLGLMLFATWNDLQRHRVFNLFGGLFS